MNQREIANELGVSQTTVSMVLNNPNTDKISREKREQILSFLQASKYMPLARTGKTGNIGCLCPIVIEKYSSFYERFVTGIEKAAQIGGYSLVIEKYKNDETVLPRGKFDGAIVESKFFTNMQSRLLGNIPLVILNNVPSREIQCDSVCPDNAGGVEIALNYLKEMGHSRIAYFSLGIPDNIATSNIHYWQRLNTFRNLCWSWNFDLRDGYIQLPKCDQPTFAETERKIRETLILWSKLPEPPTAVLCCNDEYALLMIRQASQLGMKIPDTLSIIGTDNITSGEFSFPALTTIDHDAEEMGRLSAEMLIKRIQQPERPPLKISCNASLVIRESVANLNPGGQ